MKSGKQESWKDVYKKTKEKGGVQVTEDHDANEDDGDGNVKENMSIKWEIENYATYRLECGLLPICNQYELPDTQDVYVEVQLTIDKMKNKKKTQRKYI